jgi:guanylate kinase
MPDGGRLIVISAPSGAGKTTIAQAILRQNPSLAFSVSATTRPRRVSETDGKDYVFLGKEEFRRRGEAGEFVEWEEIYGELYGTLRSAVDAALAEGKHLLFDIDVKGGLSIKQAYPQALLIFIAPPSAQALRERLIARHTENAETLARRLARVPMEMSLGERFDHVVVNDDLTVAIQKVQTLVSPFLFTRS